MGSIDAGIRTPHSMADLRALTTRTAEALREVLREFREATESTANQAAMASADLGRQTGRKVSYGQVMNVSGTALDEAEGALRRAAEVMAGVYAEFERAGVPRGVEW